MQIKLKNGGTYDVLWIAPAFSGDLLMEMKDDRPLSVIAAEFEGVETIEETKTGVKHEGYTSLIRICRPAKDSTVQISLAR